MKTVEHEYIDLILKELNKCTEDQLILFCQAYPDLRLLALEDLIHAYHLTLDMTKTNPKHISLNLLLTHNMEKHKPKKVEIIEVINNLKINYNSVKVCTVKGTLKSILKWIKNHDDTNILLGTRDWNEIALYAQGINT